MRRNTNETTARPGWMRWFAAVCLFVFATSSALAGFSFVWCIPLGQARLACCCHAAAAQAGDEARPVAASPTFAQPSCCETRKIASLDTAEPARQPLSTIAARVACVLPSAPCSHVAVPVCDLPLSVAAPPVPQGRAPPPIPLYKRHARFLC